jgi:hypothetical protein
VFVEACQATAVTAVTAEEATRPSSLKKLEG